MAIHYLRDFKANKKTNTVTGIGINGKQFNNQFAKPTIAVSQINTAAPEGIE